MSNRSETNEEVATKSLFTPGRTIAWKYIELSTYPWEVLSEICNIIPEIGNGLSEDEYERREGNVWIHRTADVAQSAYIGNSVIIGERTEIRHGAYIRGNALVGSNAVIGNSTELKNVILFDGVQVPHYNYVGDSILGYKAHMGAGAITSNVKNDRSLISVQCGKIRIDTGLKKFGAILGDNVEVGCNSVLNPGSVIGIGTLVYPLSMVRGFVPSSSIYKRQGEVVIKYQKLI